jgi:hypothetical protein
MLRKKIPESPWVAKIKEMIRTGKLVQMNEGEKFINLCDISR